VDAITRLIAPLFPGWAASRLTAQAQLARASRYFEAVNVTSQRPRRGGPQSADAVVDKARGNLREFSRWLDENSDLAVSVLDDLVTNVVGVGAGIEPTVTAGPDHEPAEELNRQLAELWAEFWERPEVTGTLPGPEVERIVCRSWLRDGEVFGKHVLSARAPHHSRIPYSLELLEADYVPYDLIDTRNNITHGVQKDGWGRPVGYWVSRVHPGELLAGSKFDVIWHPADRMMHLRFARRLHQTRGVSVLHAVLTRLDDLKDYEESERIAARVAAALTAFVKRDASLAEAPLVAGEDAGTTASRSFAMEPGLIFDGLLPGEDVGIIDSKRPNPNLEAFRSAMLRAVAGGTGARYSSIARNYNGSYSAQRQELVEAVAHYRRLFSYMHAVFYLPVWRNFIDASRLAGLIRIPAGVDLFTLYRPEVRPPVMPWIDPLKEIKAYREMVEGGFRSRHQVIRDLAGDPATVDAQLEADPLDIRPLPGVAADAAPPVADEDDDDQREAA